MLWPFLGIAALDATNVSEWIKTNTQRDHFFVPGTAADALPLLETYVRGRLGPAFEGG